MAITADDARKMVEYASGVESMVDEASEHIKLAAKIGLSAVEYTIHESIDLAKAPIDYLKVDKFRRAIERLGFQVEFGFKQTTVLKSTYVAYISW